MKKTKMFYGNQYIGSVVVDGSKPKKYTWLQIQMFYAKRAFETTMTIASILVLAGWVFTGGVWAAKATITPHTVYGKEIVEVPVSEMPPVLARIIQCESGGKHYDKNGQVLMRANKNKSIDIGIGQINEFYWGKKASELGYDLTDESSNLAFTQWLFANYGSEPWIWTKPCWNK